MTQQTLREEFEEKFPEVIKNEMQEIDPRGIWTSTGNTIDISKDVFNFFLARFKEFAEEMIGEDEDATTVFYDETCCTLKTAKGRNALRNEQRKILSEKLK